MQIFANGKQQFYSFMEFYVIYSKKQGVKIWSQYHFNIKEPVNINHVNVGFVAWT